MIQTNNFKAGLLGRKLSHSFSPQIHAHLADYAYTLVELEPEEVGAFMQNLPLDAMNVTIPYKKTVMPYLAEISEEAQKIGSVNTITRTEKGLRGDNTDYYGFSYMLQKSGISVKEKKCLVLGSGGASVTVQAVLRDLGARVTVISRSGENNYDNIQMHNDADVIVNTTPVGMYPHTGVSPVDLSVFEHLSGVLDLIYNPAQTQLLLDAKKLHIPCINGLTMLTAQAKKACELFLKTEIADSEIDRITSAVAQTCENIILIGMPGCGKSTAGQALAKRLGRKFADTDAVIEQKAGMPIPQIFAQYGEAHFRVLEHEAVCECAKQRGLVLATGGGVIKTKENFDALHQNGRVIWLQRDLSDLPVDGRPLSQKDGTQKLYEERKPLYEHFCDATAQCEPDVQQTAENILTSFLHLFEEENP
ncbi:MAG: shikimate kinase [Clostridia bacterium]|nr:shikimate kinase [Clostridia bacterium]